MHARAQAFRSQTHGYLSGREKEVTSCIVVCVGSSKDEDISTQVPSNFKRLIIFAFISEFSVFFIIFLYIYIFLSIIHATANFIIGDFNLHMDDPSDSMAREFLNLLIAGWTSHNMSHSWLTTEDTLVLSYGLSVSVSSVVDLAVSDHYCVCFFLISPVLFSG